MTRPGIPASRTGSTCPQRQQLASVSGDPDLPLPGGFATCADLRSRSFALLFELPSSGCARDNRAARRTIAMTYGLARLLRSVSSTRPYVCQIVTSEGYGNSYAACGSGAFTTSNSTSPARSPSKVTVMRCIPIAVISTDWRGTATGT
jgi:hypothetical protein